VVLCPIDAVLDSNDRRVEVAWAELVEALELAPRSLERARGELVERFEL